MRSILNIQISRLLLVSVYSIGVLYTLFWFWLLLLGPALIDDQPHDFIPQPFTVSLTQSLPIYLTIWSGVVFVQILLRWRAAPHPRWWAAVWVALALSQWVGFWALIGLMQLTRDGLIIVVSGGVLVALAVRLGLTRILAMIDILGARVWIVIQISTALSLWLLYLIARR